MPEYHIAPEVVLGGISQDLKRMFWLGKDYDFLPDLWAPGVGQGLYEFVGTGHTNDPTRIDLDNSGNPISECSIGSFTTGSSEFDGFSPDGNIVWFTVKACEGHPAWIYARADSSKSYFASESHCTRTAGDPGGACNAPVSPQYEGVSHDGSRVVFSTTQQLVNGDTDNTKDLYEYVLPTASEPNPSPNLIPDIGGGAQRQSAEHGARLQRRPQGLLHRERAFWLRTMTPTTQPPFPGDFNLYVWEQTAAQPNGVTKFVTRLEDPPNNYDVSAFGDTRHRSLPTVATWSLWPTTRWSKPIPTTPSTSIATTL